MRDRKLYERYNEDDDKDRQFARGAGWVVGVIIAFCLIRLFW